MNDCKHKRHIALYEKSIARYHEERQGDPLLPYLVANAEAAITNLRNQCRRFCR